MKLYTRRGDDGGTDLFGGGRVPKDHVRVQAYGTVDELNSAVGLALCACRNEEIAAILRGVQNRLFELGSDLAMPRARRQTDEKTVVDRAAAEDADRDDLVPRIGDQHIQETERHIDAVCAHFPAMRSFILPGGTELAARLHLARTICRRAERLCVTLDRDEPVGREPVIYLNRLSDLLFALARRANQLEGVEDVPWTRA